MKLLLNDLLIASHFTNPERIVACVELESAVPGSSTWATIASEATIAQTTRFGRRKCLLGVKMITIYCLGSVASTIVIISAAVVESQPKRICSINDLYWGEIQQTFSCTADRKSGSVFKNQQITTPSSAIIGILWPTDSKIKVFKPAKHNKIKWITLSRRIDSVNKHCVT